MRGECLIDLHAVEIIKAQVGSFEGLANSGSRADTHNLGRDADYTPGNKARHRLEAILTYSVTGRKDNTGSGIVYATGITGRHHAALTETGRELCQDLHGSITNTFILRNLNNIALAVLDRDRHDLFRQPPGFLRVTCHSLAA